MKRLLTLLTVLMFGLATFNQAIASTTLNTVFYQNKKDGTPDKRYKANKQHLKKDGTPDKRYKANKTPKKAPK